MRTILRIVFGIILFLAVLWIGGYSWSRFKSETKMKDPKDVYTPVINQLPDLDLPDTSSYAENTDINNIEYKTEDIQITTEENLFSTNTTDENITTEENITDDITNNTEKTTELNNSTETTTEKANNSNESISAYQTKSITIDCNTIDLTTSTGIGLLNWLTVNWKTNATITFGPVDDSTTSSTNTEITSESVTELTSESAAANTSTEVASDIKNELSVENYSSEPYIEVNNNVPYFTSDDYTTESFETYSDLDDLGRCGVAYACIGKDLMPTEKRGSIGKVKPSGWHTSNYNEYPGLVDGNYLYNRCHLIAYMLAGENANEKNLITGTRYLNIDGMLPFEDKVHDYMLENEDNHVLYRVTPIFKDDNLVADGVLIEAYSVEDNGKLQFCVFCYNVQPNIVIDYKTGDNHISEDYDSAKSTEETTWEDNPNWYSYILNENSKKIHLPDCENAQKINSKNRTETNRTYKELTDAGYKPCGVCHPEENE